MKVLNPKSKKRLLGPLKTRSQGSSLPRSQTSSGVCSPTRSLGPLTTVKSLDRAEYDKTNNEDNLYSNGRLGNPMLSNHSLMHLRDFSSSLNPAQMQQQVVMVNRDTDSVEVMLTEELDEPSEEPTAISNRSRSSVSSLSAGSLGAETDSEIEGFSVIASYCDEEESGSEPGLALDAIDSASETSEEMSEQEIRTVSPLPPTIDDISHAMSASLQPSEKASDVSQNQEWEHELEVEYENKNDVSMEISDIPIETLSVCSQASPSSLNLRLSTKSEDEDNNDNPLAYARKIRALKPPVRSNKTKTEFESKNEHFESSRISSKHLDVSTSSKSLSSLLTRNTEKTNKSTVTAPPQMKSERHENNSSNINDKSSSSSSSTGNLPLMDRLSRAIQFGEVLAKKEEEKQQSIDSEIRAKEKRLSNDSRKRLDKWQSKSNFGQKILSIQNNSSFSPVADIPMKSKPQNSGNTSISMNERSASLANTPKTKNTQKKISGRSDTEDSGFIPMNLKKNENDQQKASYKMSTPPARTSLQRALIRKKQRTNDEVEKNAAGFPSDEKISKLNSFKGLKPPPLSYKPIRPLSPNSGKNGSNKRPISNSPTRSYKSCNSKYSKTTSDTENLSHKNKQKPVARSSNNGRFHSIPRNNTKTQRTHLGEITNQNRKALKPSLNGNTKKDGKSTSISKLPKREVQEYSILSLQMLKSKQPKKFMSSGSSVYSQRSNCSKHTQYSREYFSQEERAASMKRKQKRINQIHHAFNCKVTGLLDPDTKTDICQAVKHCNAVSRLLKHVQGCKLSGDTCEVPSCTEFKRALRHYERCRSGLMKKSSTCILCQDTHSDL